MALFMEIKNTLYYIILCFLTRFGGSYYMYNNNRRFQPEEGNTRCTAGRQNEPMNGNQSQSSFPSARRNRSPMAAPAPCPNVTPPKTGDSDTSHSQTVGVQGPVLLQDTVLHFISCVFSFSNFFEFPSINIFYRPNYR